MAINTAPDPENYQIGKGIASFKPEGDVDFVDLGNCSEIEYEPSIDKLDHFSSRTGIKTKDKSVVLERGGTLRVLMEEATAFNLQLLLMGTIGVDGPAGEPSVDIFTQDTIRGEFKFQATNDVGPRWDWHLYNVEFAPSGSVNLISDEWNNYEVTGEVLVAPETDVTNAGKTGLIWCTNAPTTPLTQQQAPEGQGGQAAPAAEPAPAEAGA
jgi:hypothetical protein